MKQKTKQDRNVMFELENAMAALFVIVMLGLFPLFFQDSYFNIVDAKMLFFYFCSAALIVMTMIFSGAGYFQERKRNKAGTKGWDLKELVKNIPVTSWFAGSFLLSILIATVFSVYPAESFYATDGRRLGTITFVLCIVVYAILGKFLKPNMWMAWVFLISNSVVSLVLILQFFGLNVFHMWDNMAAASLGIFVSTIGNIDACATYYCMVLPVGMVLFFLSDELFSKVVYSIFLIMGFFGAFATTTEGWLLGVGAAFLVIFWFSLKDHDSIRRFCELCLVFWGSCLVLKLSLLASAGNTASVMLYRFRLLPLQNFMVSWHVLLIEGILLIFLWCLAKWADKKEWEVPYRAIRIGFFLLLAVIAAVAVILALVANLSGEKQWEGAFQWMNMLKLQDDFGSKRGIIWKQTWAAWKKLPIGRKFFGYGINCFHQFLYQYQSAELANHAGRVIDPHNEILQFMSLTGIFGMVSYFGLLISTAVSAGKMVKEYPVMMMGAAMVWSYLAQSMVNNPTAFLTPVLFLHLGILKGIERHYKEKGS